MSGYILKHEIMRYEAAKHKAITHKMVDIHVAETHKMADFRGSSCKEKTVREACIEGSQCSFGTTYQRLLELVTKSNGDLNSQNHLGESPLMLAILEGNLSTVELLVEHGADVNLPDNNGYTSLMYGILKNREEIVQYLLNAGAKVELKNKQGKDSLSLKLDLLVRKFLIETAIKEQIQKQAKRCVENRKLTKTPRVTKDHEKGAANNTARVISKMSLLGHRIFGVNTAIT